MRINKKAFTLVELMLVVVIIGILVAMVMPRLAGRAKQAKEAAARADIDANLASALDLYEIDNGKYPASLGDLLKKGDAGKGPYIKKAAKDPWGHDYVYQLSADSSSYTLVSYGPDGIQGNDDISNEDAPETKE